MNVYFTKKQIELGRKTGCIKDGRFNGIKVVEIPSKWVIDKKEEK